MKNINSIKSRIKSVQQTMQVTKAMDIISIAKKRKVGEIAKNNALYFDRIVETVQDMVRYTVDTENVYLNPTPDGKIAYIIIASDKGLCGSYNHIVLKWADRLMRERHQDKDNILVYCVGQMTKDFFASKSYKTDFSFVYLSNTNTPKDAAKIASTINDLYASGEFSQVNLIYSAFKNGTSQSRPDIMQVLPILISPKPDDDNIEDQEYFKELIYEPSIEQVLSGVMRQYLVGVVYGALVHSAMVEHTSRSMAMSNASKRSKDVLADLNTTYNMALQEQIALELAITRNSN